METKSSNSLGFCIAKTLVYPIEKIFVGHDHSPCATRSTKVSLRHLTLPTTDSKNVDELVLDYLNFGILKLLLEKSENRENLMQKLETGTNDCFAC